MTISERFSGNRLPVAKKGTPDQDYLSQASAQRRFQSDSHRAPLRKRRALLSRLRGTAHAPMRISAAPRSMAAVPGTLIFSSRTASSSKFAGGSIATSRPIGANGFAPCPLGHRYHRKTHSVADANSSATVIYVIDNFAARVQGNITKRARWAERFLYRDSGLWNTLSEK